MSENTKEEIVFYNKQWLTPREVGKILGVDQKTVWRWIMRKYYPLPAINTGTPERPSYRIKKEELAAWMESLPDPRADV